MRVKIDLDREMSRRLVRAAVEERRPIDWQAEVILRRALGLPFPRGEINGDLISDRQPATSAGK